MNRSAGSGQRKHQQSKVSPVSLERKKEKAKRDKIERQRDLNGGNTLTQIWNRKHPFKETSNGETSSVEELAALSQQYESVVRFQEESDDSSTSLYHHHRTLIESPSLVPLQFEETSNLETSTNKPYDLSQHRGSGEGLEEVFGDDATFERKLLRFSVLVDPPLGQVDVADGDEEELSQLYDCDEASDEHYFTILDEHSDLDASPEQLAALTQTFDCDAALDEAYMSITEENRDPAQSEAQQAAAPVAKKQKVEEAEDPLLAHLSCDHNNERATNRSEMSSGWLMRDTDTCYHLRVGLKDRMFKVGETFTNKRSNELEGHFFTITKLSTHMTMKQASVDVFLELKHTFIGPEFASLLSANQAWVDRNGNEVEKVWLKRNNNDGKIVRDGQIPLKLLTDIHRITPTPKIVYIGTNKKLGENFDIAYVHLDTLRSSCRARKPSRTPVVLDLFAGAGGMSRGLAQAGFDVRFMVEKKRACADTLFLNHFHRDSQRGEAVIFDEDVRLFLSRVEQNDPAYPSREDVDHLHASSPCQGFSTANRNGGMNDLSNNKLSFEFVNAIKLFHPRTASFENVTGMLQPKNIHFLKRIVAELLVEGYQVRVCVLQAADYGVPQSRRRLILLASLDEAPLIEKPAKTRSVTFKEALGDLVEVEPKEGSGRVILQPANKVIRHHNLENTSINADSDHLSQRIKGFATTVLTKNPCKHYCLDRGLTIRERARLQTFPDYYNFCGSFTDMSTQIGNAVPIKLAFNIGKSIMECHTREVCCRSNINNS